MADPSPRDRQAGVADRLIGLAAPVLDLILAIGDRVSRVAEPTDYEYYPIRPASERELPEQAREADRSDSEARPESGEGGAA